MATRSLGTLTIDMVAKTAGLQKGMDQAERRVKNAERSIKSLSRSLKGFGAAIAGAFSVAAIKSIVDAGLEMERFERALKVATGSASAAAREMGFVTKVSTDLGLSLVETTSAYSRLAAAARGTALEGQAARDIFLGIAEASTVLGLTAEQTGGALTAIEQIISKGKVSAEELRGQLGERLPGAFQIAARSIGVTTSELDDMLRKGEVLAEDLLPSLATELHKTFGADAAEAADSAQSAFNRLNNSIVQIKASIADSGLTELLAAIAERAATVLAPSQTTELQKVAADLGDAYNRLDIAKRNSGGSTAGAVELIQREVDALRDRFNVLKRTADLEKETGSRQNAAKGFGSIAATNKDLDDFVNKQAKDYAKALESFAARFETAEEKAASLRAELNLFRDDLTAGQIEGAEAAIFDVLTSGIEEVEANFSHLLKKEGDFHGAALAQAAEARSAELEGVRQFLASREELELEAYARRAEIIANNMAVGEERNALLLQNAQRYADQLIAVEQYKQDQINAAVLAGVHTREQFENASAKNQVKGVLSTLTQLTAGVAVHDKRMFALNKVASIASAIVNTAEGVTKALSEYPPPLSFVMAAAQAAAGAAQIATIRSTSFGGGTTPSVSASTPTLGGQPVQSAPTPEPRQLNRIIEIQFNGNGLLAKDDIKNLLTDMFEDDEVVFGANTRQAAVARGG